MGRTANEIKVAGSCSIKAGIAFDRSQADREKVAPGKLHFDRVAPLFKDRFQIEKILALNIKETRVLKQKNYHCLNPVYSKIPLSFGLS